MKIKPIKVTRVKSENRSGKDTKDTKNKKFLPNREKISETKGKGPLVVKKTGGTIQANTTGAAKHVPSTVKDLKGAAYNPRVITEAQLKRLRISYEQFGDLSGIVFNAARGVLISGHQRLKTMAGKKTKLVRSKIKDGRGTIAAGHIEVVETDGSITRVPYREVTWSDKKTEMAANVAANAHGGDFDDIKLGGILSQLTDSQFDIELTGIDELNFRKMVIAYRKQTGEDAGGGGDSFTEVGGTTGASGSSGTAKAGACKCPRCGFKFTPKLK